MPLQDSIILHTVLISIMGYSFYKTGVQIGIRQAVDYIEEAGLIEFEPEN